MQATIDRILEASRVLFTEQVYTMADLTDFKLTFYCHHVSFVVVVLSPKTYRHIIYLINKEVTNSRKNLLS